MLQIGLGAIFGQVAAHILHRNRRKGFRQGGQSKPADGGTFGGFDDARRAAGVVGDKSWRNPVLPDESPVSKRPAMLGPRRIAIPNVTA